MEASKLKHLLYRIAEHDDERAFSTFFDHYYTRLMNLVMVFIPQYDLAEEVVSEVFIKLLQKRKELLNIDRFEGYLFTMVKNRALNFIRSRKREAGAMRIDDIEDHLTSDYIDPEKKLMNSDLRAVLNQAIQKLPPKRRLVFKMVKDERMSYREVAGILEISERTVEVHLKLAVQDLRNILSNFYQDYKKEVPISKPRKFMH